MDRNIADNLQKTCLRKGGACAPPLYNQQPRPEGRTNKDKGPRFTVLVFVLLLILCGINAYPQTAGQDLAQVSGALAKILGFFSSSYMKAILTIALGGLGLGIIMNRGETGIVKKFLPWITACIILLSLSAITGVVFPTAATIEADSSYWDGGK